MELLFNVLLSILFCKSNGWCDTQSMFLSLVLVVGLRLASFSQDFLSFLALKTMATKTIRETGSFRQRHINLYPRELLILSNTIKKCKTFGLRETFKENLFSFFLNQLCFKCWVLKLFFLLLGTVNMNCLWNCHISSFMHSWKV